MNNITMHPSKFLIWETGEEEFYNTKHEEEFLYIEGGRELEQAVQGGDGVSLSGGIKHPAGWVSVLPALDGPALAVGLDWISKGPFQLWGFCDSVIQWAQKTYQLDNTIHVTDYKLLEEK